MDVLHGAAYPNDVKIDPKEDPFVIMNTSGSTGTPKGVIQTHHNFVSYFSMRGLGNKRNIDENSCTSLIAAVGNFFASLYYLACYTILSGSSFYTSSKFERNSFMNSLLKYKPEIIFLLPYGVHEFLQHPEIEKLDLTFLKMIQSGGSVFNYATAKALEAKLPHVKLTLVYGSSEVCLVSTSRFDIFSTATSIDEEDSVAGVKFNRLEGDYHMSSGPLDPMVKAKVVDTKTGRSLGRNKKGKLLVKTEYMMKGYIDDRESKDTCSDVDENGWYDIGDIAYFDEKDYLYVVDRNKFTFKYHGHWVSPTEVEAIILKHPAVVSAVVVGVPDPKKTSIAKAYVVLKPGCKVTEEEIKSQVAENAEVYKHLYGGVSFVESLPLTEGGKLDRPAVLKKAIAEIASNKPSKS